MAKDNSAQVAQLFNEIRDQRDAAIAERDAARAEVAELRDKLNATRAELRKVGDQGVSARLDRAEARAEAATLRTALVEMRAYINKYVTLTDTERWLLTTIEAALPSDNSSHDSD